MNRTFSAEDEAYRVYVRQWLEENSEAARLPRGDPMKAIGTARAWQKKLYEAGFIGMAWPKEYGGQDATLVQQVIVSEELSRAGAPGAINMIGLNILGPTLISHGTDEQRQRFLPKILSAEELWCQGFSEPGAGSDLASLTTKAELHGDVLVVNGQKVWTSLGPVADWIFLLVRTDPRAPKRKGISYLLCDIRSPGLTVRPLRNAAGGIHFSEVFLQDVEIPLDQLVGDLNDGWKIARTTLDHERSGLSGVLDLERQLENAWTMITSGNGGGPLRAAGDATVRRTIARRQIEIEALRYLGYRVLSAQLVGRDPGPQSAVGKLFASELRQRIARTALEAQGPYLPFVRKSAVNIDSGRWQTRYLDSLAHTIGGGTSEIMRNVIAERVLGLPRSVEDEG